MPLNYSVSISKIICLTEPQGFPGGARGKEPACHEGDIRDAGSIPGLGRSPRGGNGNPLQYSCLENPMDRGAWWATAHGVEDSDTTEQLTHTSSKGKQPCLKQSTPC